MTCIGVTRGIVGKTSVSVEMSSVSVGMTSTGATVRFDAVVSGGGICACICGCEECCSEHVAADATAGGFRGRGRFPRPSRCVSAQRQQEQEALISQWGGGHRTGDKRQGKYIVG